MRYFSARLRQLLAGFMIGTAILAASADATNNHQQYNHALAAQQRGQTLMEKQEFQAAYQEFESGLELLGFSYADSISLTEDDTGLKHIAAKLLLRDEKTRMAASSLNRTLEVRMALYREKYGMLETLVNRPAAAPSP
jgi:hypothetical protein